MPETLLADDPLYEELYDVRREAYAIGNLIERDVAPEYRWIEQDTDFYGVKMKQGEILELGLGAANRDPTRWDDPDLFDLHRPRQTNMAFGLGTYRCLGMNVAQVEISVGISALLDAFPNLRLDHERETPFMTGGLEQRGVSGLPVLLR
jgi:cytochrome P450